jgi:uncharacterized phiE125 gp8 family phage protein|tara:strand:+ start:5130 stop:5792 length:663 start_codon:yes stop_codon:yes gene_type:complete
MARLTITSAASSDILTTAEAKTHLRVTHSAEDTYIGTLIKVATSFAEKYCGGNFINTSYTMTMEDWKDVFVSNANLATTSNILKSYTYSLGGYYSPYTGLAQIFLPKAPISSVASIAYFDSDNSSQIWSSSNYNVINPENQKGFIEVVDGQDFPSIYSRADAVNIAFVSGYGAASSDVPDPIKQAVLLIIGNLYEKREDMVHRMPTTSEYLLEPYRIWEY